MHEVLLKMLMLFAKEVGVDVPVPIRPPAVDVELVEIGQGILLGLI